MEVAVREGISVSADFVHVCGIKVYHAGIGMSGSYGILENCDALDGPWSGLGVYGKYNTFLHCRFNNHGDTGITGAGEGHRFIGCETSYNNYLLIDAGWHSGGVKLISTLRNVVFEGHLASYNHASPGIWFDWCNSQIAVQNCVCHHNGNDGIMYEVSTRGTFVNNICYENGGRNLPVQFLRLPGDEQPAVSQRNQRRGVHRCRARRRRVRPGAKAAPPGQQ